MFWTAERPALMLVFHSFHPISASKDSIIARTAAQHWIEPHPHGIYVTPADMWIDPSQPSARALVTHGHADHARGGHGDVWATPETLAIMGLRYGTAEGTPMAYGEQIDVGGVKISFHSAGHVFGSAQILLEHAGERVVVTGDYKRRADPTCALFEPIPLRPVGDHRSTRFRPSRRNSGQFARCGH
jgi:hypothetical protein